MPLPKPSGSENEAEFIARCMSNDAALTEFPGREQRLAVCASIFEESKSMDPNQSLLEAVRSRGRKRTEFRYGIITADKYVSTLQDDIGVEKCALLAANRLTNQSFQDALTKAANTLVYSNDDMDDVWKADGIKKAKLPKNTLMAFRHVLTTTREDRDGDVLKTAGAQVDPSMLLLWQHVPTLPIGKLVGEHSRSNKRLEVVSAIVDVSPLAHDAAVMVDNGMARFSHGFRAIEFDKRTKGDDDEQIGFEVKQFEIMEESLVSVPSNVDASVQEILLDLVEGGKLTSPILREYGAAIRKRRPAMVSVPADQEEKQEAVLDAEPDNRPEEETAVIEASASEEADAGNTDTQGTEDPGDKEVKFFDLPGSWEFIERKLRKALPGFLDSHGVRVNDLMFVSIVGTFANHVIVEIEKEGEQESEHFRVSWTMDGKNPILVGDLKPVEIEVSTEIRDKDGKLKRLSLSEWKRGRVISNVNEGQLRSAAGDMDLAKGKVMKVLDAVGGSSHEDDGKEIQPDAKRSAAKFLAYADATQRGDMLKTLQGLEKADKDAEIVRQLQPLIG